MVSQVVKDALVFYARFKIAQTVAWAAENPARAMLYTAGGTAAMTNPTARGIVLKVAGHLAREAARNAAFYSRLAATDILAPAARAAATTTKRAAVGAATTPAVAIPLVAVTAATAGGVASAAITTGINRQHNVPSSSPVSMWSPFGGMQLGTVV